jgi:hypothetical protein
MWYAFAYRIKKNRVYISGSEISVGYLVLFSVAPENDTTGHVESIQVLP